MKYALILLFLTTATYAKRNTSIESAKDKLLIAKHDIYLAPHETIHAISDRCHLKTGDEDRAYRTLRAGREWQIDRALKIRDYVGLWVEPSSVVGIFCDPSINNLEELKKELRPSFEISK